MGRRKLECSDSDHRGGCNRTYLSVQTANSRALNFVP